MRRTLIAALLLALPFTAAATTDLPAPTTAAPFLACDGTDFLAVWTEPSGKVRASRVSGAGVVLDTPAIDLGPGLVLGVAYGAGMYLVVSTNSRGLVATRVTQSGVRIDEFGPVLDTRANSAALVFDGARFFVTWTDGVTIYSSFVTPDANVSLRQTLATRPAERFFVAPSVAWDGRRFLVVWTTAPVSCFYDPCLPLPDQIVAFRVAADGALLDSGLTHIATAATEIRASVTSSGQDFLIAVRRKGYDTIVTNANVDAVLVDAETGVNVRRSVTLSNLIPWGIAVAWTGSDYEVMWSYQTAQNEYRLATARIDRAGTVAARRSMHLQELGTEFSPATTSAGEMAIAARLYGRAAVTFDRDVTTPLPTPPAQPSISLNPTSVTWSASGAVDGFVVENVPIAYDPYVYRLLVPPVGGLSTADLRTPIAGSGGVVPTHIRVRAFNAGGFSEPSTSVPLVVTRGRPARH